MADDFKVRIGGFMVQSLTVEGLVNRCRYDSLSTSLLVSLLVFECANDFYTVVGQLRKKHELHSFCMQSILSTWWR